MASCKDCLHVDVCCSYLSTVYNKCKLATPDFELLKNIECDECQHFKDRSRFVELPCKVGDTVYFILRSFDGKMRINPEKVCYFTIDANELRIHTTAGYFTERDMNDGVFFTRERAEQVLKERET